MARMADPYHATDSRSIVKADRFGGRDRRDIGLPGIVELLVRARQARLPRRALPSASSFRGRGAAAIRLVEQMRP